MVTGFPPGDTQVGFEIVDAPFHDGPDFIKGNPFIRIPLDARKHTEIHVFVGICGVSFFSRAARGFTIADPLPLYHVDFWTDPFVAV